MHALPAARLASVVEAAGRLAEFEDLAALHANVLDAFAGVVRCDLASYNEIRNDAPPTVIADPPDMLNEDNLALFGSLAWQNPLVAHCAATGDKQALRFSDLIGQRQFRQLEIYQAIYRELGVEHQIALAVNPPGTRVIGLAFSRRRRDFDGEDAAALNLLRPHLHAAFTRLTELDELRHILWALDVNGERNAVVLVDDAGNIVRATPFAEQALGTGAPAALPEPLRSWVVGHATRRHAASEGRSLRFLQNGRLLTARLAGRAPGQPWAIVIRPDALAQTARSFGLSSRETEVLQFLGAGHRIPDIAGQLAVSTRTVEKHLEHIYRKLGVANRASALQRLLSQSSSPSPEGAADGGPAVANL